MRGGAFGVSLLAAAAALALAAPPARAQRPAFAKGTTPLIHDGEHVRVHYVTTSDDAVPPEDADESGVPDFVEQVADLADISWQDLVTRGFRTPLVDAGLVTGDDGGDERFDIYLTNLNQADGSYVIEACTEAPIRCAGYFSMENDLAGFNYDSIEEGISVLTSHELFHAVQAAYVTEMAVTWSEGTAMWNEEQTFPEQDDYETKVAAFLARPDRPFDRGGGGFGDRYVYGTALWPTFLEERYGDGTVQRSWEACEALGTGSNFLDAIGQVLDGDGESLEAAWIEFSRWNLFTGERADPSRSYQAGAGLALVASEQGLTSLGAAETTVEGMSARYLPIAVDGERLQVSVEVDDAAAAAFYPQDGGGALGDPVELVRDEGLLSAVLPGEARGILVLTSVRRGGLPRPASVEVAVAPPDDGGDGGDDDDEGGCQAARSSGGRVPGTASLLLVASAFVLASRRRRGGTR
jgi:hypothetical protein